MVTIEELQAELKVVVQHRQEGLDNIDSKRVMLDIYGRH